MANKHKLKATPKTIATILSLAEIQCTQREIASALGVCEKTFITFKKDNDPIVKEALSIGYATGNTSLRRKQFALAEKNAAMAIWLGKQYLGQKEEVTLDHKGQIGIDARASLKSKLLSAVATSATGDVSQ